MDENCPVTGEATDDDRKAGVGNVVITAGAEGSYGYDGQHYFTIPAFSSQVISTVGAGDAHAAACVVGLHRGLPLNEAMRLGAANAASVVGKWGAKEGILTWQEALDFIADRSRARDSKGEED